MKLRIVIIGSTGKLGIKLLNFCKKKNIDIFCITGFKNKFLLKNQSKKYDINHSFKLSESKDRKNFKNFLIKYKVNIIYFLDYGFNSLVFADIFLKNNSNSKIAIANKEMIIAGGETLINKISKSNNKLIPLDSEHFSLINSGIKSENLKKIYITASGGPFYFKKNTNLNNVKLKDVLAHPKWKMGLNNSIDSSNFINKILEIYELSIIYKINLSKIDFLINKEAYIHSIFISKENIININCFDNDMLITLISPLLADYPNIELKPNNTFLNLNKLKLEKFYDKRFKINKYFKTLKELSSQQQISFMILNNIAQKKYLLGEIKYNFILDFIMMNLKDINAPKNFKTLNQRINFINTINSKYET
tara:strand:+ start:2733 stop:3821 length:1089 start_codon:yes stop_codon:yes gene_type:complete